MIFSNMLGSHNPSRSFLRFLYDRVLLEGTHELKNCTGYTKLCEVVFVKHFFLRIFVDRTEEPNNFKYTPSQPLSKN